MELIRTQALQWSHPKVAKKTSKNEYPSPGRNYLSDHCQHKLNTWLESIPHALLGSTLQISVPVRVLTPP